MKKHNWAVRSYRIHVLGAGSLVFGSYMWHLGAWTPSSPPLVIAHITKLLTEEEEVVHFTAAHM